jgi:hypothetical protein
MIFQSISVNAFSLTSSAQWSGNSGVSAPLSVSSPNLCSELSTMQTGSTSLDGDSKLKSNEWFAASQGSLTGAPSCLQDITAMRDCPTCFTDSIWNNNCFFISTFNSQMTKLWMVLKLDSLEWLNEWLTHPFIHSLYRVQSFRI